MPSSSFQPFAKKALGQHFLTDPFMIDCIVQAVHPKCGEHLVEIGPGRGALTFPILRKHGQLTVIEFDRDLIAPLAAQASDLGQLNLIHANVLDIDLAKLEPLPIRLVGNLPYNLSSPILFHALKAIDQITDMHFMLQKEVVERMAAQPGSKVYGRLSVILQALCTVENILDVPPSAFSPPPKVDSAVVRLTPLPANHYVINNWEQFSLVVQKAFGQRRKTLRNALRDICSPADFEKANVNPSSRAEELSVSTFVALSNTSANPSNI